jgi:hypothetical protein
MEMLDQRCHVEVDPPQMVTLHSLHSPVDGNSD